MSVQQQQQQQIGLHSITLTRQWLLQFVEMKAIEMLYAPLLFVPGPLSGSLVTCKLPERTVVSSGALKGEQCPLAQKGKADKAGRVRRCRHRHTGSSQKIKGKRSRRLSTLECVEKSSSSTVATVDQNYNSKEKKNKNQAG